MGEPKEVKGAVEAVMGVASGELKKHGSFKLAGMLALKLKKKPATPARKGVNPFTKEPSVFQAKPASKTVRVLAMKKRCSELTWDSCWLNRRQIDLNLGGWSHQV